MPAIEITEQFLRDVIRAELPRLIRCRSKAVVVEEMEVCSGRARVDIAVIADRLIGIEIKGPKDDVSRLAGQVQAYSKCFDRVVLVVHQSLAEKAIPLVPFWWGVVIVAVEAGEFRYRFDRRPRLNPHLDMNAFLSLLWREEIGSLLGELLGISAQARATKRTIRDQLLAMLDVPILHGASLAKLRSRSNWRSSTV